MRVETVKTHVDSLDPPGLERAALEEIQVQSPFTVPCQGKFGIHGTAVGVLERVEQVAQCRDNWFVQECSKSLPAGDASTCGGPPGQFLVKGCNQLDSGNGS